MCLRSSRVRNSKRRDMLLQIDIYPCCNTGIRRFVWVCIPEFSTSALRYLPILIRSDNNKFTSISAILIRGESKVHSWCIINNSFFAYGCIMNKGISRRCCSQRIAVVIQFVNADNASVRNPPLFIILSTEIIYWGSFTYFQQEIQLQHTHCNVIHKHQESYQKKIYICAF